MNVMFSDNQQSSGFSLVELIVVIAIVGVLSSVIIARYNTFDSAILLRNLAYDVALSIREAQALGVSVRGEGGTFTYAYGVHFDIGNSYILFRDIDDDGVFDSGEEVSVEVIREGGSVSDLCGNSTCGKSEMDVTFKRPNPDAQIVTTPATGGLTSATVEVMSRQGSTRTVQVWPTGQISVE